MHIIFLIGVCNGPKSIGVGIKNGSHHQQLRANSLSSGPPLGVQDIIPPPQDFGGEYSTSLPRQNNGKPHLYNVQQQQPQQEQTEYRSMQTQVQCKPAAAASYRVDPQGCAKSHYTSGMESDNQKVFKTSPN